MTGVLYEYLSNDHDRLDGLLRRAMEDLAVIDMESFAAFRKGLLRHIAMEEKIVFPAIEKSQGGKRTVLTERLHLDHGALVALMVPPPSASIVSMICSILEPHNTLEEQEGGLYDIFQQLAGSETERLSEQLRAAPEVPVLPYNDRPGILDATRRAVERAGYEFKSEPR